jgi:hypothetical protein
LSSALISDDFPGAARTGEQHVVGRLSGDEVTRIGVDPRFLLVDVVQVVEPDGGQAGDRLQIADTVALAPAKGFRRLPVGQSADAGGSRGSMRSRRVSARSRKLASCRKRSVIERYTPRFD